MTMTCLRPRRSESAPAPRRQRRLDHMKPRPEQRNVGRAAKRIGQAQQQERVGGVAEAEDEQDAEERRGGGSSAGAAVATGLLRGTCVTPELEVGALGVRSWTSVRDEEQQRDGDRARDQRQREQRAGTRPARRTGSRSR